MWISQGYHIKPGCFVSYRSVAGLLFKAIFTLVDTFCDFRLCDILDEEVALYRLFNISRSRDEFASMEKEEGE